MFSIPFYFILVAYFIFLAIFFLFSTANVYHIYSTGTFTIPAVLVTTIVSALCVVILFGTFTNIISVNWNALVVFFGPGSIVSFQ